MQLAVGSRWKSSVCATEIVIVRPAEGEHVLECGGAEMVPMDGDSVTASLDPSLAEGSLLGKRYSDDATGLEVLCTKAGEGSLVFDGARLEVKSAKPLPSSD
jgi:hypothetical protein